MTKIVPTPAGEAGDQQTIQIDDPEAPSPASRDGRTENGQRPAQATDNRVKALRRFGASITVFTVLGHVVLGFEQAPITPVVAALVSYVVAIGLEFVDSWSRGTRPAYTGGFGALVVFLLPAHITALACAMLLYGNTSLWPYLFAVVVAHASKYVFRVTVRGKGRHFLNPSNFGIVMTLLLFPWVGIAPPYHFTNVTIGTLDWLVPLAVLTLGTMINAKITGKWPLVLGWIGGFVLQAVLRWILVDHSLVAALLPMTGVAFVLFTNYMIPDPGTSPSKPWNQVVFGVTTAVVYGVLVSFGVVFGLFFALVITCVLRGAVLVVSSRMSGETRHRLAALVSRTTLLRSPAH
ncbi:hypothetical protein GCM10009676_24940 [Prauserella halophila]|uniref:Enediyne biosynthesis protein UnbU n=1 Tax=Prauserella halophila TaxID=185641 RepID=A0ABN1W7L3_9PSEU|nr:RnfABCDGE type electron transport complex subunit D [Prauserella halophila]MCP2234878.1 NQR2, RnfD, RnfE family [Prauserella halophila]